MATDRAATKSQRFPHLDALRVFATLGVLVFHSGRAFDSEGWHVKNAIGAVYFDLQTGILSQWLMPLFFLVSGWVTYAALSRSGVGKFAGSRASRLLVPFVLGTLILVPPQVYIERVTQSGVRETFIEWFPHYFDGFYALGGNFAWMGLHLWYLGMLFVFSMLFLPFLLALRRPARWTSIPGWVLPVAAATALVLIELVVNRYPDSWGMQDFGGWSPVTYMVWFLIGHEIGRSERFQRAFVTWRWVSLAVGVAALAIGIAFATGRTPPLGYIGESVVRIGIAFGGIAAMLGFSARHLMRPSALMSFANAYVLQFYVLHQTVIVLLVFGILGWAADPHAKFLLVLVGTFALTAASLCVYNAAKAKAVALFKAGPDQTKQTSQS